MSEYMELRKASDTLQAKLIVLPIMHLCLIKTRNSISMRKGSEGKTLLKTDFGEGEKHTQALTHNRQLWPYLRSERQRQGLLQGGHHFPPPISPPQPPIWKEDQKRDLLLRVLSLPATVGFG